MIETQLSGDLIVRAPHVADAASVAALYNACSLDEIGAAITSPHEIGSEWQVPGFDLAQDAWLVMLPAGRVVGYLDVWSPEPNVAVYSDGRVHPDYRGRGIGTYLLQMAEARSRELTLPAPADARLRVVNRALSTNEGAKRLFEAHGYRLTRHYWRMSIELDAEPPEPVWPEGITVRNLVAGQDERLAYEADEEAFQDHYDHTPISYETWLHWDASDPEKFDPSLWFLALDGEAIAGLIKCELRQTEDPEAGWVGTLAVRRPWRRRGLGLALLHQGFRELYRRGQRRVGLTVDAASLTGATRLYERAGMRVVRQTDAYEKALRAGGPVGPGHTPD
jgi:mycothiol synthase